MPLTQTRPADLDERMRATFDALVREMVDDPEAVEVSLHPAAPHGVLVSVAETDRGKVIGKQGHTARALRTIAGSMGMKYGEHWVFEIEE